VPHLSGAALEIAVVMPSVAVALALAAAPILVVEAARD
jgi:hypothetical protein